MTIRQLALAALLVAMPALLACSKAETSDNDTQTPEMTHTPATPDTASAKVRFTTTAGDFTVLLYGDTPKHRDNFLHLVADHYYDSTLFHRVIPNFMIQAGDPDSRHAAPGQMLGSGGPDYKIDAEIIFPGHFHKRGVLAAARQGDQVNPMKQSSGSQFYIVTGDVFNESQLAQMEQQKRMQRAQTVFNELAMQHRDEIMNMRRNRDQAGLQALQNTLAQQAQTRADEMGDVLTPAMRQAYTTVGGAPHLDGEYTVFGEVIDGMDTVARIEQAQTDRADRPVEDIRILSATVVE